MRRVSKKQKRIKSNSKNANNSKKIRRKAKHLLLGPDHFYDREVAEWLRKFPHVPRKIQKPFPRDREVGFVGHYQSGKFAIQNEKRFVADYEANAENAWYWRQDKREGRNPTKGESGLVETNAALSSGYAMVLAAIAAKGDVRIVRNIMRVVGESGMAMLGERSGYKPVFMACHPDWEGTMSVHFGLSPVDFEKRMLIGRSADGKRGRKGLRTLGDSFTSVLRHSRLIELPADLLKLPKANLRKRKPDDWAVAEEMDRVVREELSKLPDGPELLRQADEYQKEAAEDWLRRYQGSKAGVDKRHCEMEQATARIADLEGSLAKNQELHAEMARAKGRVAELEEALAKSEELREEVERARARTSELEETLAKNEELHGNLRNLLKLMLSVPEVVKAIRRAAKDLWNRIVELAGKLGLEIADPEVKSKPKPKVAGGHEGNDDMEM